MKSGWFDENSIVFDESYVWLKKNGFGEAKYIGISNSGRLKYALRSKSSVYIVHLNELPVELQNLIHKYRKGEALPASTERAANAAIVYSIGETGNAVRVPNNKAQLRTDIEKFAVDPKTSGVLEDYWNSLCTAAGVSGVRRRTALNPTNILAIENATCTLHTVSVKMTDGRADGDYTEFWENIYRNDIAAICVTCNQRRHMEAVQDLRKHYADFIRPAIEQEIRKKFNLALSEVTAKRAALNCFAKDEFGITCAVIYGQYGRSSFDGTAVPADYCDLLLDGTKVTQKEWDGLLGKDTKLHTYSWKEKEEPNITYALAKTPNQATLNAEYHDALIRMLKTCVCSKIRASYLDREPDAVRTISDAVRTVQVKFDANTDALTVTCVFGTLKANKEKPEYTFIQKSKYLAARQQEQIFSEREAVCAAMEKKYGTQKPDRIHRMTLIPRSGDGILIGDTKIAFSCGQDKVTIAFTMPSDPSVDAYQDTVENMWKDAYGQLAELNRKRTEAAKQERKELYQRVVADPLDGAILRFIEINETYITAVAVQEALRGVSVQLNTVIHETSDCGMFNLLPGNLIVNEITRLINANLLSEKTMRGTYGKFYILKLTTLGRDFLDAIEVEESKLSENEPEWWKYKKTYGWQIARIKEKAKNGENTKSDCVALLHHIDDPHMIAYYHDDIVDCFNPVDVTLKIYLRMVKSTLENNSLAWKLIGHIVQNKHLNAHNAMEEGI